MSLFPAYCQDTQDEFMRSDSEEQGEDLSSGAECVLLAEPPVPAPAPRAAASPAHADDFYLDRKLDSGNLRVSTLYYPARPEYRARDAAALGASVREVRAARGAEERASRPKRYWRRAPAGDADAARERAARAAAFRRAVHDTPHDEELWLRYIDFLEWCGGSEGSAGAEGAEAAVDAAREGAALLPESAMLGSRLHAALRRALSPLELAMRLRDMRAEEQRGELRAELWAREVSALACAGALDDARDLAAAAARDRAAAPHHHNVLLVYGCVLRSAGLWEQLVQLVELLAAMNFPPSAAFPPARCAEREAAAEAQLAAWEEKAMASGLPRGAVWARVERARAALHWRPPLPGADALELAADPQRAPPRAALADLLAPAPGALRLLVALLRLAETPLLPAAGYVARAAAGGDGAGELAADWEAATGPALVALVRAARRLPPAHPAHPARAPAAPRAARLLLQHTPLRDAPASPAADTTGFGAWARGLWAAALAWAGGAGSAAGAALLCWRLRVLHARVLLADTDEETRALRNEAREALREWAGGGALPFAVFARLEAAAGGAERGARAALRAARHALAAAAAPAAGAAGAADTHVALYAARVVWEMCGPGEAAQAQWALASAAARRPLPAGELRAAPPPALLDAARQECEQRCRELERQFAAGEAGEAGDADDAGDGALLAALLPGAAEWGAARALLAPPARRAQLAAHLHHAAGWRGAGARYREQCACALAGASAHAAEAARALAALAPGNAYLALLGAGAAPWGRGAALGALGALGVPRAESAAWAALLPALLRAAAAGWPPAEARRACGALGRALRGAGAGGGALLHALRLEAAPDPRAALTHALARAQHCKWVLVRGAALGAGEACALAELALERALRLHALPDELAPRVAREPATHEQHTSPPL